MLADADVDDVDADVDMDDDDDAVGIDHIRYTPGCHCAGNDVATTSIDWNRSLDSWYAYQSKASN